jgi:hypothetical protein
MKYLIKIVFCFAFQTSCISQNDIKFDYNNFEQQILKYEPTKKINVTQKTFDFAKMVLSETKIATKNDSQNFNRGDYYNILSALVSLHETESNLMIAFEKLKNAEDSCEYFLNEGLFESKKFNFIRNKIDKQIQVCTKSASKHHNYYDLKEYSEQHNLNYELISLMHKIDSLDQKFRKDDEVDWKRQRTVDTQNQESIDSLYNVYNTYLGKSLVGEKYKNTMWQVIQHSNLNMMEKYLPLVQKAINDEEIDVIPFKMLIDRIYSIKYGYQIFGSQMGVDLADEKLRKDVQMKYGIN